MCNAALACFTLKGFCKDFQTLNEEIGQRLIQLDSNAINLTQPYSNAFIRPIINNENQPISSKLKTLPSDLFNFSRLDKRKILQKSTGLKILFKIVSFSRLL